MDQIYSGADLTIVAVAAAGHDKAYGLPGVSTTPRIKCPVLHFDQGVIFSVGPEPKEWVALDSHWATRAWTFQECVLSRRLLVFKDHQMTFYCQKASWMEALGGPRFMQQQQDNDWDWKPHQDSLWDPLANFRSTLTVLSAVSNFTRLMEDYTRRNLSYEADALKAVSGLFSRLLDNSEPMFNLSGLPYDLYSISQTAVPPLEEILGIALAWCHTQGDNEPKRRFMFPSWTWAGWTGAVYWKGHGDIVTSTHQILYLRSIRMLNDADEEVQHGPSATQLQKVLDSITVLVFEAPVISIDLICPK